MDRGKLKQALVTRLAVAVFGLLTLSILALAVLNDRGVLQVWAKEKKLLDIQGEILAIEKENRQLLKEIKALRTDPDTIERLAREELKLVKPGDVVVILPGESAPRTAPYK